MALIAWRKDFETGVASIDHEHKQLIETINDVYDALESDPSANDVEGMLGDVHALIEAHFALEEQTMREMAYDAYAEHKAEHDDLLEEILDIIDAVADSADFDYGDALGGEVSAWFGDHFASQDRRLHTLGRRSR